MNIEFPAFEFEYESINEVRRFELRLTSLQNTTFSKLIWQNSSRIFQLTDNNPTMLCYCYHTANVISCKMWTCHREAEAVAAP